MISDLIPDLSNKKGVTQKHVNSDSSKAISTASGSGNTSSVSNASDNMATNISGTNSTPVTSTSSSKSTKNRNRRKKKSMGTGTTTTSTKQQSSGGISNASGTSGTSGPVTTGNSTLKKPTTTTPTTTQHTTTNVNVNGVHSKDVQVDSDASVCSSVSSLSNASTDYQLHSPLETTTSNSATSKNVTQRKRKTTTRQSSGTSKTSSISATTTSTGPLIPPHIQQPFEKHSEKTDNDDIDDKVSIDSDRLFEMQNELEVEAIEGNSASSDSKGVASRNEEAAATFIKNEVAKIVSDNAKGVERTTSNQATGAKDMTTTADKKAAAEKKASLKKKEAAKKVAAAKAEADKKAALEKEQAVKKQEAEKQAALERQKAKEKVAAEKAEAEKKNIDGGFFASSRFLLVLPVIVGGAAIFAMYFTSTKKK